MKYGYTHKNFNEWRVILMSHISDPLNTILQKKSVVNGILGEEVAFENAWISIRQRVVAVAGVIYQVFR